MTSPAQLLDRQSRILERLAELEDDLHKTSACLAQAMRDKRDLAGLSNQDIATRTGIPYTSVVNWMYGNTMFPEKEAKKVLALLKAASRIPVSPFRRKKMRKVLTR